MDKTNIVRVIESKALTLFNVVIGVFMMFVLAGGGELITPDELLAIGWELFDYDTQNMIMMATVTYYLSVAVVYSHFNK